MTLKEKYIDTFSQILGGLSFSCTSWALRRSVQVQMVGTHQGSVTSVSQWGDDQSGKDKFMQNVNSIY